MECIILAGGLGTRIRSTIGDLPKCMAVVNNKPFLHYIFHWLQTQNCTRVVLSLGYKYEAILDWLKTENLPFEIDYVVEEIPLGTGGGMQLALQKCMSENVLVLNGDTLFQINAASLLNFHIAHQSATTLALKTMHQFERYGAVKLDDNNCISGFEEKSYKETGFINGGIYVINRSQFLNKHLPEKFSFEKDYLEAFVDEQLFYGQVFDNYFIDIGIPEDYQKAQEDFLTLFP